MNNSVYRFIRPKNEPVLSYAPGSKERKLIKEELQKQSLQEIDIPLIIGGKEIRTGNTGKVVMPHNHRHILATYHLAGENEVRMAIEASLKAKKDWYSMDWIERNSIFLKVAELLEKKYRAVINASTMLGQSKNPYQAEIDSACETIDFMRFNAFFCSEIYANQPNSDYTMLNRMEFRPLEGFVFVVTPFNFTSIAANLNTSPALMGNTVIWKPATTSLLSNYYLMKIFMEAGLPDGVINFVPGKGSLIGNIVLDHIELGGIHFTGSTRTFSDMWIKTGQKLRDYISYPKLVGETGGKDFVVVHPSADVMQVVTALVRGAFEYQGQKCSAASRAYIPVSLWKVIKPELVEKVSKIRVGDVMDFRNFMNAVIDENAFDFIMSYIERTKKADDAEIITGGKGDKSVGYFIEPTIIETKNPQFLTMREEIFGPVLTIYVYDDDKYEETLELVDKTSPYALTGAVFALERNALVKAYEMLRFAAGNLYYNDKPTGAVVGQQPFGGARASGTNDKAGSYLNLTRWINPRVIKENFLPPSEFLYSFMEEE